MRIAVFRVYREKDRSCEGVFVWRLSVSWRTVWPKPGLVVLTDSAVVIINHFKLVMAVFQVCLLTVFPFFLRVWPLIRSRSVGLQ